MVWSCRAAPEAPRPQQPGPLLQREPAGQVVRLDAAEAERLAREARQEVAAQAAAGLELSLWAPEALIADPVAITIDDRGRLYATQTQRDGNSTIDIRGHRDWMVESISLETVEDRRRFLRRELAPERSAQNASWLRDVNGDGSHDWRDLTVTKERLYRILDTTGDGRADLSQLMLEDFHTEVTDVAGGLLVRGEDIYLGVSPDVWRLRDTNGDGLIDFKESMSHGYMVHVGFGGHGLSGIEMGPDGRVYWSVGDIGLNVVDQQGRRWEYPNQGAILRSEPDGSNFEVFAAGLRNTHEFAFDEYGNLISVDNDGDHPGETERVVYITQGQDSGWRINWQFGKYVDPTNNEYKVWMEEGMFRPRFQGQAAWFTPPVAAYHSGPAGMVYNPGTALTERWRDHFFVSEFTGTPARSRIHAFQLREQGAGFELARDTVLLSGILTVGMDIGPDGSLYLADWIEGWDAKGRGRIWKLDAPAEAGSELRAQTEALLAADFAGYRAGELRTLLAHADQRVRLKAQFALAERGEVGALQAAARQREHALARLHGLWGLGQIARREPAQARRLVGFLRDADAEVRAQAAKVLGDVRHAPAAEALVGLLADEAPRVRFFAAEALGRLEHAGAVPGLIAMLEANQDRDVYLRHAGALALARIGAVEPVAALARHPSRGVRIAAVVALRRMRSPEVGRFLGDAEEYVVAEAARAINDDGGIEGALPALARVLEEERFGDEALLRRAINANLRLGTAEAARRVAEYARRTGAAEELRVEAIAALGVWPSPSVLDRVDGMYLGPEERDPAIARAAVEPLVRELLAGAAPAGVQVALAEAVGRLGLESAGPVLLGRVRDAEAAAVRVAALRALQVLRAPQLEEAVRVGLRDGEQSVRMVALGQVAQLGLGAGETARLLEGVLAQGTVEEQQSALGVLGELRGPESERVLRGLVERWRRGELEPGIRLEVREAVEASNARELRTQLSQLDARATAGGNPVAAYAEALRGGHAGRGRQVVFQNAGAQCTRCHTIGGNAQGADVGPPLGRIGAELTREQLLEALVAPSERIAPGYGMVTLTLRSGERVAGTLREEGPGEVVVETASGEVRRVGKGEIAQRANAPSAMPPMGHILSRRELRDVVEFLSTLR